MLPFTSLDAVTSAGAGAAKDLEGAFARHTLYATESGTHSDLQVRLEGSHDGLHWFGLGSVTLVQGDGAKTVSVDAQLVRYVRAALASFTGSTTVTATIASA